jgi:hypothetical protein
VRSRAIFGRVLVGSQSSPRRVLGCSGGSRLGSVGSQEGLERVLDKSRSSLKWVPGKSREDPGRFLVGSIDLRM